MLDLLGAGAYAALGRGETVPALRATTGGSPVETLTRLFVLQSAVPRAAARAALPDLDDLVVGGLLRPEGASFAAEVDLRPYAAGASDCYVASDLGTGIGGVSGRVSPEHVLGVGGASTTLAQLTVRPAVERSLDLGTGCGVQALHLAGHSRSVVATDSNPRALAMAALSVALSDVRVDLREGSLFDPVDGERFDLVVSNPPFVVSPAARFAYQDAGLSGDELGRVLVERAPTHLADGGWCQLLANWLHVEGQDWRERLAGWVVPTGCDAWVVQREVLDPMQYAELWLRDSGDAGTPGHADLYAAWLESFAEQRVEAVGFGWVTLRASGADQPFVRIEDLRRPVDQPVGPAVLAWFERRDRLRTTADDVLLGLVLRAAPGLRLEEEAEPGPGGFREVAARLRQLHGLRRSGAMDPVGAAVVGACDGSQVLADVLDRVAAEHGIDPADLREGALAAVRTLVEEGFLDLPPHAPVPGGPV